MLFFRSEELVKEWCRQQGLSQRPLLTLDQVWQLARAWYAERLTPEAQRPMGGEMTKIFARIGLEGPFWDPEASTA